LNGAQSIGAEALGPAAVKARWRMRDGKILMIAMNLANAPIAVALDKLADGHGGTILFETDNVPDAVPDGILPAYSFIAVLEPSA
jgi:maltooligosyltrehalose trehalohydrolase